MVSCVSVSCEYIFFDGSTVANGIKLNSEMDPPKEVYRRRMLRWQKREDEVNSAMILFQREMKSTEDPDRKIYCRKREEQPVDRLYDSLD